MDDLSDLEAQTFDAAKRRDRMIEDELASLDESKQALAQPRTRGWFADVGASAVRGVTKAVASTHEALSKLADTPSRWLGEHLGDIAWTEDGFEFWSPAEVRKFNANKKFESLITGELPESPVDAGLNKVVDFIGEPETKTGAVTQGISQFLTGLVPVSRLTQSAGVLQGTTKALTAARGLFNGAITSGVAFDNTEGNLANLMQEFPALQNPVSEFLATDADDSEVVGRLKNAVTDAGGGAIFESFLFGLRGLRNLRKAKAAESSLHTAEEAAKPELELPEPNFTLTDEPLTPAPVKVDEAAAAARDARAAKLSLVDDSPAPVAAEKEAAKVEQQAAQLEAKAEQIEAEVAKSKPTPVKELSDEEHHAKLRADLGITDEKLAELRKQITNGEIKPEEVTNLLGINPDRIDWSGVTDAEDMVGLINAFTKLTDDAAGKAGYARVSVQTTAKIAEEIGGNADEAIRLWERLKSGKGVEAGVLAQRVTLMASAARLQRLAKKIASGAHEPQDLLDFVAHDRRHALLQTVVRGTRAMIGRSLRIMREGVKVNEDALKLANGRRLREARKVREKAAEVKTGAEAIRAKADAHVKAKEANDKALAAADAHVKAKKEWEDAVEAARSALDKAHANRMLSEKAKAKAATKEAEKAARAEAKEAQKAADKAAKDAKAFEDLNAKAGETKGADVALEGETKMQLDEVERSLAGLGLRTDDVLELARAVERTDGMIATHAAARAGLWQTFQDRLSTLYINNILSGLPTMVTNISSGFYKLIESTVENYGAAALGTLRKGDRFDRIVAHKSTVAAWTSWRAAFKMAGKAWKEGVPQTDILAKAEVAIRGGSSESLVGKVITAPSRVIITIDEFFKHIFYKQELTARAVEVAASAARLQPTRALQDKMFAKVMQDTLNNPPDDLVLDAIEKSRYNTFQSNLESKAANTLIKLTNDTPIFKLIVPFIKTPSNIVKQGFLERSPLALARKKVWSAIAEGGREGNVAATRAILGTLAVASVWEMADRGLIHGSNVGNGSNKNTADLGATPNSVRIGDKWYQFSRLDPIGMVLSMTADLRMYWNDRRAREGNEVQTDDPEAMEWFGSLIAIVNQNMLDKTYFKGISDFFDLFDSGEGAGAKADHWLATTGSNLVPFSSLQRNIARAHDEYAREAWGFVDKLMQQTPLLSEKLPPKRDVLGRPVPNTDRVGADWMSPFVVGKDDPDPAAQALASLKMGYRMPSKEISGIKLNEEQYSHLLEVRGGYIKSQLDEWLKSGEWNGLTRFQREEKVRRWQHSATTEAKAAVLAKWPDLGAAVGVRKEELAALKGGELDDE